MSGYKTFAFTGAGNIGKGLIEEFVKLKEAGTVQSVIALTRAVHPQPTPLPLIPTNSPPRNPKPPPPPAHTPSP